MKGYLVSLSDGSLIQRRVYQSVTPLFTWLLVLLRIIRPLFQQDIHYGIGCGVSTHVSTRGID